MPTYQFQGHKVVADHDLSPDEIRHAFKTVGVDLPGGPGQTSAGDLLARRGFNPGGISDSDADGNVFSRLEQGTIKDLATPPTSRFNAALKLAPYALPGGGPSGTGVTGELVPEIKRMVGSVEGKNPLQWIRNYRATMPSQMAKDAGEFLGRSTPPAPPVPAPAVPSPLQPDAIDAALAEARQARAPRPTGPTSPVEPMKGPLPGPSLGSPAAPKPSGPPPVLRKAGSAPSVTDSIRSALEDARRPVSEPGTTPPAPTQTVAGKPSVTLGRYDELQGAKPPQPSPATAPPSSAKAAKLSETNAGADALDELQSAMNGGKAPAPVPNGGAAKGIPDQLKADLDRLRRTYGADRIASEINPNAPEPVVGAIVKKTGAPSAMPDVAQKALLDHLKDPTMIKNPGNFHRALSQLLREYKRNGGTANSDVARQVADTLRKYGYDVP
jgi:hypothetical protein